MLFSNLYSCFKSHTICPAVDGEGNHQVLRLKKELNELRVAFKHKDQEYTTKENDLKTKVYNLTGSLVVLGVTFNFNFQYCVHCVLCTLYTLFVST